MTWDTILSDLGEWWGRNEGWIKPVAQVGMAAYQGANDASTRNNYVDQLRQNEQANYDDYVRQYQAQNEYQQQLAGYQAAQSAAASRASAARAAAARQTEANRRKALQKAQRTEANYFKQSQEFLAPYIQMGKEVLPQTQALYGAGANAANSLLAHYMNQPPAQVADVPSPLEVLRKK